MQRPRISVVTPSFNQERFIRRTIDSVLGQDGEFDLEYLVVDGASTDGTREVLESYGGRLRWVSEPDSGQVDAINKGMRWASGDILAWVNSDDTLCPGALARVVHAFSDRSEVHWLHGRCRIVDENDREIRRWISLYKHLRSLRYSPDSLLTENFVSQVTTFWRREAWNQAGPLDSSLDLAFDYDLWLRLARLGAPAYLGATPLGCFRWYETSKSGSRFARQFGEDAAVAARYAGSRRSVMIRKRLKSAAFVAVYRLLGAARALRRIQTA